VANATFRVGWQPLPQIAGSIGKRRDSKQVDLPPRDPEKPEESSLDHLPAAASPTKEEALVELLRASLQSAFARCPAELMVLLRLVNPRPEPAGSRADARLARVESQSRAQPGDAGHPDGHVEGTSRNATRSGIDLAGFRGFGAKRSKSDFCEFPAIC